jgi:predicted nuclease of predicted toxin-antitoxin system
VKFLVDAQLTPLLCEILYQKKHDAIHVNQLPSGDETSDKVIIVIADLQNRIVVTKDSDFYHAHVATGKPAKLLLITTGNIKNSQLLSLIRNNITLIESLFENYNFVELSNTGVIAHEI